MSAISPELVERMAEHFRRVAKKYAHVKDGAGNFNDELRDVRAIVADLPAPVDPDLIEARTIAARTFDAACNQSGADEALKGTYDDQPGLVSTALAAIKRGRELERGA